MSEKIYWNKYTIKDCPLGIQYIKPNYNMTFHRNGKQIGILDFNGPEMTFTGDAEESAKVFFDWIAESFKSRLEHERAAEREACESEYPVKFASVQAFEDWCASIRANEREACAKWLEERDAPYWAEQIRARGQQ